MRSVRESLTAKSTQAHHLKKVPPVENSQPAFWANAEAKESTTQVTQPRYCSLFCIFRNIVLKKWIHAEEVSLSLFRLQRARRYSEFDIYVFLTIFLIMITAYIT